MDRSGQAGARSRRSGTRCSRTGPRTATSARDDRAAAGRARARVRGSGQRYRRCSSFTAGRTTARSGRRSSVGCPRTRAASLPTCAASATPPCPARTPSTSTPTTSSHSSTRSASTAPWCAVSPWAATSRSRCCVVTATRVRALDPHQHARHGRHARGAREAHAAHRLRATTTASRRSPRASSGPWSARRRSPRARSSLEALRRLMAAAPPEGVVGGLRAMADRPDSTDLLAAHRHADARRGRRGRHLHDARGAAAPWPTTIPDAPPRVDRHGRPRVRLRAASGVQPRRRRIPGSDCC